MDFGAILAGLASANQAVALATEIGGVVVPLGKFIVKEVKQLTASGEVTVDYQVVLTQAEGDLAQAKQDFTDTLSTINAELAKLGQPPLDIPT